MGLRVVVYSGRSRKPFERIEWEAGRTVAWRTFSAAGRANVIAALEAALRSARAEHSTLEDLITSDVLNGKSNPLAV
jgi:hypothetical protein